MKLKSRPVQSVLFLCCYVLEFGVFKRRPALPGMVKTAHREFPKKYLEQQEVKERGDHVAAVTEQKGVKLLAVGWADKKRKLTVSTYGNTLPGTPHKKRRWTVENGFERAFTKEVKRPSIVEHYFDAASAIDVHNHFRQGIVSLETAVKTQRWDFRLVLHNFGYGSS